MDDKHLDETRRIARWWTERLKRLAGASIDIENEIPLCIKENEITSLSPALVRNLLEAFASSSRCVLDD